MSNGIKRLDILEALQSEKNYINNPNFTNKVANVILKKLKINRQTSDQEANELKEVCSRFCRKVRERWKKVKGVLLHILYFFSLPYYSKLYIYFDSL